MKTRDIHQTVRFSATTHEIYELLMDSEKHGRMTNSIASIDRRIGGRFTAADGYITGETLELVRDERIVQRWRGRDWPEGHLSTVTFELRDVDGETELTLTHLDVPEEEGDMVDQGWHKYYWQPIKSNLRSERTSVI
jgi:activator of HSP90 ATPase